MPRVSVIIPVYNAAPYLGECLDSVRRQTFADYEVLVVDDGSTDGSGALCDAYAASEPRAKVLHQPNKGLSATRNRALDIAAGDFVVFLDADDMLHPRALEVMLDAAATCDAEIVIAGMVEGVRCRWRNSRIMDQRDVEEVIADTLYQRGLNNSMSGKLFARSLFRDLRFREGRWYEDLDLFYRLYWCSSRPVVVMEQSVYFYRDTPGSFINTFNAKRLDVLKVTADIEEFFSDCPTLLPAAHDRRFSANFNMFVLCSRAGMEADAEECWQLIRRYRRTEVSDRRVRLKNKVGALASYLGRRFVLLLSKMVY